ncbi:hypothetical protein [Profundibacter sp.]
MKLQIFGFAAIVAMAITGVDYSMQARATGQSLGQLGATGYVDTITGRFQSAADARALKTRQKQAVKIHLPEAPEGWIRQEWAKSDTTRFESIRRDMSSWEIRTLSAVEVAPMMAGMVATDVQLATKLRRESIWVYERGGEMIALRVVYNKNGKARRFPGLDTGIEEANIEGINSAVPYAFVQGIGFGEVRVDREITGPVTYRGFSASMGDDIMIAVRADASDASILALMGAIDYDGLNGMLDVPLAGVGTDAAKLDPARAMELAAKALEQRRAALLGDEPVAPEVIAAVEEAPVEASPEAEAVEEPAIGIGFDTVTSMPGQKCVRKTGSSFCSGFTTE